jgi:hypothetical protein
LEEHGGAVQTAGEAVAPASSAAAASATAVPRAQVCRHFTCGLPSAEPDGIAAALAMASSS